MTKKQVKVSLIPTPGAKPEFLATLEAANIEAWLKLPSKINLEGYTRDAWAWKPGPAWHELLVVSIDGRNKLPGFVSYLKERKKCAFGRFSPTALICVSYIQTKKTDNKNEMTMRICLDMSKLSNCPLYKGKQQQQTRAMPQQQQQQQALKPSKPIKQGMLGNLLGARKRTDNHLDIASKPKKQPPKKQDGNPSDEQTGEEEEEERTAQEVLTEFRQKMEDEMLDFDNCGENVLRTRIALSEMTKGLAEEDKGRVTMEVLKYIVFEAAEECNEEWIAHQEPTEFMDECTVVVYKEGHAPEDVLEEVNRVELTSDMKSEANKRKQGGASNNKDDDKERLQNADMDNLEVLNQNKRDRRSIDDIQKEPAQKKVRQ